MGSRQSTQHLPFLKCVLQPEAYSSSFLHNLTARSPLLHSYVAHLSNRVARSESIYRIGLQSAGLGTLWGSQLHRRRGTYLRLDPVDLPDGDGTRTGC